VVPLAAMGAFPIETVKHMEPCAMTDEQKRDLREFVNSDLLGVTPEVTLHLTFSYQQEGEDHYTEVNLWELLAYLQEQYGLTNAQAQVVSATLDHAIAAQADAANEAIAEALQEGVDDALETQPSNA